MPRKQVYGKRTKAIPFSTSSNGFFSSSPAKAKEEFVKIDKVAAKLVQVEREREAGTQNGKGIEEIERQLEELKLENVAVESSTAQKKPRKVLRTMDGNTVLAKPAKAQDLKSHLKPVSVVTEIHTEEKGSPIPMAKERKGEPPEVLRTCSQDTPREETDEFSAHVRPLLKLCSDPVSRYAPVPFATWSARLESHFSIAKIAEASYGEVYRLSLKSSIPGFTKADESVLKIIALEPPKPTPGVSSRTHTPKQSRASAKKTSWMSAIPSVESEVKLLQRMTPVPGFTNFRDVRVLQGRPAPAFVAAWKAFNKGRKKGEKSIFPDPSRKASYAETQLWAVVEMQDAGTDLENVVVRDVWSVWDVFWGVALAVGKGEEGMRFEHRDLHLGNICIRPPSPTTSVTSPTIRITNRNLNFTGLETTIIDYTLSRAGMSDPSPSSPQPDTEIAYLDLDRDLSLFTADATHEYQYEVYRYMRNCVLYSTPLAACNHAVPAPCDWKGFHPLTNLIWLHFLLHKLLQNMDWPSAGLDLSRLAPSEDAKLARRKARRLERALVRLRGMLEPEALGRENEGLESVRELVAVALGEGWLEEGDVVGIWREEVEG